MYHDYYTSEPLNPARKLWKGILSGLTLSAAIAGLLGCLAWLVFATCSI